MAAGDAQNPYIIAQNDGTEGDWQHQLAKALAAVAGGLGGRALAGDPNSAIPPQVLQLLNNSVARQGYQNPLYQATTKGVFDMLPDFAKEGSQLSGSLPSTIPPADPWNGAGGGQGGPGLKTAAGLGGLAALLGGGSSGGVLGSLLKKIRDLFGGHGGGMPTGPGPGPATPDPVYGYTGPDYGPATPDPTVNTDEFFASWPETNTPFGPLDPSLLPGSGTGRPDNPYVP